MEPEHDPFADLPGLARFGAQLDAAARRPTRRWWSLHGLAVAAVALFGVTATAAATVGALRATVIPAPDAAVVPADQQARADSGRLLALRAPDPAGGPPWALRLTRSETGQTCTTVGQIKQGAFGIVGEDRVFRRVPPAISDACGTGLLVGARIVAGTTPRATRSVVYGVAGSGTRTVTLTTTGGARTLKVGPRGTFVATLRGYPEDTAARLEITQADGRAVRHRLSGGDRLVPDIDGAPAWRLDRYALGSRVYCAHLRDARGPGAPVTAALDADGGRSQAPTACVARRGDSAWAAQAVRLRPGQRGVPGFDRWTYRRTAPRTLLLGVARTSDGVARVTVSGAGAPRVVTVSPSGVFALFLPASVDPGALSLAVRLKDGTVQYGRPGHGIVPDPVVSRRPR